MIVDIHIHLHSAGCRYDQHEVAECMRLARRAGIERAIYLFNLADTGGYDPAPGDVRRSNDLGLRLVTEHPDFFTGFCYLNPAHDPGFIEEELARCVADGPLQGIKLWVAVKATDPRLDPILTRAVELGVPVLYHAWYKATGYAYNESTPAEIADLARRHPRATIIMAHLGGGGWRGVQDIKSCPNVVVDTSGAQPQAGLVEYAVRELGAERVVYGSDWPIRDFATQVARVTGARLTAMDRASILGGNAARLVPGLAAKEGCADA
ncbi:MAG TPA: amidohydrolase family protein [Nitrolancea sp.]|nr:amidohydrolase family protein [Nitrolancea sp.]